MSPVPVSRTTSSPLSRNWPTSSSCRPASAAKGAPQGLLVDDRRNALTGRLGRIETGPGLVSGLGRAEVGREQPFAAHQGEPGYCHIGLGRRQLGAFFAGVKAYQQLARRHLGARCDTHFDDGARHLRFDDHRPDGDDFSGHPGGGVARAPREP